MNVLFGFATVLVIITYFQSVRGGLFCEDGEERFLVNGACIQCQKGSWVVCKQDSALEPDDSARSGPQKSLKKKRSPPSPFIAECGIIDHVSNFGKMYKSSNTVPNSPWQVGVIFQNPEVKIKKLKCTGVIISKYHVLTAASCLFWNKIESQYQSIVRIRENDLFIHAGNDSCDPEQGADSLHNVTKAVSHLRYNETTHENDVAILKISDIFDFDDRAVQPACLPRLEEYYPDAQAILSGWSLITLRDSATWYIGKQLLKLIRRSDCEIKHKGALSIGSGMFCTDFTKSARTELCYTAGETVIADDTKGKHYILGLSTFGPHCKRGIYTKVAHYIDWIHETVEKSMTGDEMVERKNVGPIINRSASSSHNKTVSDFLTRIGAKLLNIHRIHDIEEKATKVQTSEKHLSLTDGGDTRTITRSEITKNENIYEKKERITTNETTIENPPLS